MESGLLSKEGLVDDAVHPRVQGIWGRRKGGACQKAGIGMSADQIHRPRIPKDETKSRPAPQTPAGKMSLKAASTGSEGLYRPGLPRDLKLPGIGHPGVSRTEAAGGFAGSDPDEPHKGKNLNLYA